MERDKIEEMLEQKVNPKLMEHKGWVELAQVWDEHTIQIRFRGMCSGCGAVRATLEEFVIPTIRREMPEIQTVEVDEDVPDELYDMAVALLSGSKT